MFEKTINFVKRNAKKLAVTVMGGIAILSAPVVSHAAALVDYSTIGTSITAELTPALTAVVPIAGTLLAAMLGWKFAKRFLK